MDGDLRHRYRRDYTKETLRPLSNNQSQPNKQEEGDPLQAPQTITAPAHLSSNRARKKKGPILFILILILSAGGAGGFFLYVTRQNNIPAATRSQAEIPILYPAKLPAGYKVNKSSFRVTNGTLITYYAQDGSNNKLIFTVQPRPVDFDFNKFYSEIISNSIRFNTTLGEAAVGKANGRLLGSLATSRSWVLITGSSDKVSFDKIQSALSDIRVIE